MPSPKKSSTTLRKRRKSGVKGGKTLVKRSKSLLTADPIRSLKPRGVSLPIRPSKRARRGGGRAGRVGRGKGGIASRRLYRDALGRFISRSEWQLSQKQRGSKKKPTPKRKPVAKKKPTPKRKLVGKKKPVAKKKKLRRRKKRPCCYRSVIELVDQSQINKYNVTGVDRLSVDCLSQLIDNQIARGAYLFRFWYRGKRYRRGTNEGLVRSTHLIDLRRLRVDFKTTKQFLRSLTGPVIFYWMDLRANYWKR